jgi:hypothetical protein
MHVNVFSRVVWSVIQEASGLLQWHNVSNMYGTWSVIQEASGLLQRYNVSTI